MPTWRRGQKLPFTRPRQPISQAAAHQANINRYNALNRGYRGQKPESQAAIHSANVKKFNAHLQNVNKYKALKGGTKLISRPDDVKPGNVWNHTRHGSGDIDVGMLGVLPYRFRIGASDEMLDVGNLDVFGAFYGEAHNSATDHEMDSHRIHMISEKHCAFIGENLGTKVDISIRGAWGALPPFSHDMVKAQLINALWSFLKFSMKRVHYRVRSKCVSGTAFGFTDAEHVGAICGVNHSCHCHQGSALCHALDWYHFLPSYIDVNVYDADDRLMADHLQVTISVQKPTKKPGGCSIWGGLFTTLVWFAPLPPMTLMFLSTAISLACTFSKGIPSTGL